jgi:hypothetical protein
MSGARMSVQVQKDIGTVSLHADHIHIRAIALNGRWKRNRGTGAVLDRIVEGHSHDAAARRQGDPDRTGRSSLPAGRVDRAANMGRVVIVIAVPNSLEFHAGGHRESRAGFIRPGGKINNAAPVASSRR